MAAQRFLLNESGTLLHICKGDITQFKVQGRAPDSV